MPDGWAHLDTEDLVIEFQVSVSPLEDVPISIRSEYKRIQALVFHNVVHKYHNTADRNDPDRLRSWKFFCLLSRMLLYRMKRGGQDGNKELQQRIINFNLGRWDVLLQASRDTLPRSRRRATIIPGSSEDWEARLAKAEKLVTRGELSNAARLIKSSGLAEGNDDTYQQLTDRLLRPRERLREFPADVLDYQPDVKVQLDADKFKANLRTARRGLSGSLSGHRNEHLKCCLDDADAVGELCAVGQIMAEGELPEDFGGQCVSARSPP